MDEKKNANQAPELKDEELDQVAGGIHLRGDETVRCPICDWGTVSFPSRGYGTANCSYCNATFQYGNGKIMIPDDIPEDK